jgi:hypothetical protein
MLPIQVPRVDSPSTSISDGSALALLARESKLRFRTPGNEVESLFDLYYP